MTTTVTNRGLSLVATGSLFVDQYSMGLLIGATTVPVGAHDPDNSTVADLLGVSGVTEIVGGGYGRVQLSGINGNQNDVNDRFDIDAANVNFGSITAGTGIVHAAFVFRNGADESARDLLMVGDTPPQALNGSPVVVNITDLLRLVRMI